MTHVFSLEPVFNVFLFNLDLRLSAVYQVLVIAKKQLTKYLGHHTVNFRRRLTCSCYSSIHIRPRADIDRLRPSGHRTWKYTAMSLPGQGRNWRQMT